MEDDDSGSAPAPEVKSYQRFKQLRGIRSRLDIRLRAYWRQLVAESAAFSEAAVERAFESYAKNRPPR